MNPRTIRDIRVGSPGAGGRAWSLIRIISNGETPNEALLYRIGALKIVQQNIHSGARTKNESFAPSRADRTTNPVVSTGALAVVDCNVATLHVELAARGSLTDLDKKPRAQFPPILALPCQKRAVSESE
jgi:hypothetical protein